MGMSGVKLVARGVDTLLLNAYYTDEQGNSLKRDLSSGFVERLDAWKQAAEERVQVADQKCEVLPDAAVALFAYVVALTLISVSHTSLKRRSLVPFRPS